MKTIQKKFIILLLFVLSLNRLSAQQMLVKGAFVNNTERTLFSRYVIKTDGITISSGRAKKIKVKLDINKNYTLTVIKPGYKSKTVHFSTFNAENMDVKVSFLVLMQKETLLPGSLNKSDFVTESNNPFGKLKKLPDFKTNKTINQL